MTFQQIANQYFQELKKEVFVATSTGEATNELSHRMSLDSLFKNIIEKIDAKINRIHEPKNQNKVGRPDWRFHDSESMGVYGYVEAKGINPLQKIKIDDFQEQINKYLVLGNPVILTDGIDFVMFTPDGKGTNYSICEKPVNWDNPVYNPDIEIMFNSFFKKAGYRSVTENQLVNEVAIRAKRLSDEIFELLELEEEEAETISERKTISLLKELKSAAERSHDKSLIDEKTFAGFIAQILAFGLLYAHRVIDKVSDTPKDKYQKIHDFWFSVMEEDYSNKLIPFKTLVIRLKSELDSELSRLGIWYDDLRRLLSHIKLSNEQVELPDFHELYETFFSVFDPNTRFDYGAYYTPRALAFYMVNFVKTVAKRSLPEINFETVNHKVIDPCCGTGTFIEAMKKNLPLGVNSNIIGFEILPAPYALAHYRMTMLDDKYPNNIKIILTNTLSDNLFEEIQIEETDISISSVLLQEQQIAYQLARHPLTIIIGNPPSSDSKFQVANEGEIIKCLMEDFKPDLSERKSRQNTQKQLTNEFVKFLRWTIERAQKSIPSIFALILPSSFAKHPSYKYARKYIAENITDLWILEFDTDNRTGADGSNIFNTLQGRLILVGVIKRNSAENIKINYKNICHLNKQEKLLFFNSEVIYTGWTEMIKLNTNYSFKPENEYDENMYNEFWPLTTEGDNGIFLRHCSSLKLAPTHLLVHSSKGQLKRRSKFIAKPENNYLIIKDRWYSGQQKPPPATKINDNIRIRLKHAVDSDHISAYSYRPFIETSVLLDEELLNELSNMPGGGTRDRPEVRAAYQNENVIGFAVSPAPEDLGEELHKFSSFCWHIPDNDLSKRGNAHIFCNYFPEYKKKKRWNSDVINNINPILLSELSDKFSIAEKDLIDPLTFYCYAILSSDFYLNQFKGKLYNVAGDWPNIPITSDNELFLSISALGKQLAKIESLDFNVEIPNEIPEELEYHKYKIGENSISLLDAKNQLVKEYPDINKNVLLFEISGYNVVREWLKLHSYPYFRKKLEKEDIKELDILLAKIGLYRIVIAELNIGIKKILLGTFISSKR